MKTRISLIISVLVLSLGLIFIPQGRSEKSQDPQGERIHVISSPGMAEITSTWAEEYQQSNAQFQVDLEVMEIKALPVGLTDNLIFLTGDEIAGHPELWKMTVAREIVVPVVNSSNPFLNEIKGQGISRDELKKALAPVCEWSTLVQGAGNNPVNFYSTNEALVNASIRQFLGEDAPANAVLDEQNMLSKIENDPYALGFCKLSSLLSTDNQLSSQIALLPVDNNGNGKIDYMENIYADPATLIRGVWIGKYPRALAHDVYVVSGARPETDAETAFLQWILTTGQDYLAHAGLTGLAYSEVQSKLDKIGPAGEIIPPAPQTYSTARIILFIVVVTAVLSIMAGSIAGFRKRTAEIKLKEDGPRIHTAGFDENSVEAPRGILYDRTHTWAYMEKDGMVKIGIDDFLQHVTGTITRVELKKQGEKIRKGEKLAVIIQDGKQLTLFAPVSGTINEANPALGIVPSILNSSPYEDGWLYKVEPSNWAKETPLLLLAGRYVKWLHDEMLKLKDFLAFPSQPQQLNYLSILQDGGLLKDHILEDMAPQVWEEFQREFLDKNR
jgi:glycine cleavage system H lipoate-binding protein/ABC-type phosphate transport system substrate-binding protein